MRRRHAPSRGGPGSRRLTPGIPPTFVPITHRIREAYVKMLFLDPIYAGSKDMEQSLWKTCFYRKIEDFRKKIRKYAAVASSADNK